MKDDLPDQLRVTAEEYQPDSDRMWARVASGMSDPKPVKARPVGRRFTIPHLTIATGVAMVLIVGIVFFGYGRNLLTGDDPGGPSALPGSVPSVEESFKPPAKPENNDTADFLWGEGSINADSSENDYWTQHEIAIENDEPLTSLTVEMYVVWADDVSETGSWVTSDPDFAPAEVAREGDYLVFRWELGEGRTLTPGAYVLSGQFDHGDGVRDTTGDYFVLDAVADSGPGNVIGDFKLRD